MAAAAMMALTPMAVHAQTDVTPLFIKNAGFDANFDHDKSATGNIAQEILEVNGWTKDIDVDYTITGVYEFGSAVTFNTSGSIPAAGLDGSAGCLALSTGWGKELKFYQTVTLPAGTYQLIAAYYNGSKKTAGKSLVGWIPASGASKMSAVNEFPLNKWTNDTIAFTLTAEKKGKIQIGYAAADGGSANSAMIVLDFVKLVYMGEESILPGVLAQSISEAETLVSKDMQPKFKSQLEAALNAAKALPEGASDEAIIEAATSLNTAIEAANDNVKALTALKALTTKAKSYLTKAMAKAYSDAVNEAYNEAMLIVDLESDADITAANDKLTTAYNNAVASSTAYAQLNGKIRTANTLNKTDKQGVEELEAAIAEAQKVLDKEDATPEEMLAAAEAVDYATLLFRVTNTTGKAPTVKALTLVQGATVILGRATVPSSGIREAGLCYSTEPEPTIFENRSTKTYTNNGNIYAIEELKPATCYYVRAYAISSAYAVGYSDAVKIYTQPMGSCNFSYGYEGDDATNQRIYAACEEGVWMWNNISAIQGFHLDAHYSPGAGAGDGTADCSYGGYMRVSQNTAYQRTGTILHEGAHGLGMVPYTDWVNSIYRANGDRGYWLGARVDRVIRFLQNDPTAKLNGDTQHMWPYGINGAGEDTGAHILYLANALLVGALAEDGIRTPNQSFLKPSYAFMQDDDTKYYIKNANENRGLTTSYLRESKASALKWVEMTADEAFENDSCAWYITFNPATSKYNITNAATGKRINFASSAFRMATPTSANTATTALQLLPARVATKTDNYTFAANAYWVVNAENQRSLTANINSNIIAQDFNHATTATAQQWLILTAEEVALFDEAMREAVGINELISYQQGQQQELALRSSCGQLEVTAIGAGQAIAIYNVDGRLVQRGYVQKDATATFNLPRGLYIVNGKKVTVQ